MREFEPPSGEVKAIVEPFLEYLRHTTDQLEQLSKWTDVDNTTWSRAIAGMISGLEDAALFTARHVVIRSIKEKSMSRKLGGEILGVHQGTVARWLKDGIPQPYAATGSRPHPSTYTNDEIDTADEE